MPRQHRSPLQGKDEMAVEPSRHTDQVKPHCTLLLGVALEDGSETIRNKQRRKWSHDIRMAEEAIMHGYREAYCFHVVTLQSVHLSLLAICPCCLRWIIEVGLQRNGDHVCFICIRIFGSTAAPCVRGKRPPRLEGTHSMTEMWQTCSKA